MLYCSTLRCAVLCCAVMCHADVRKELPPHVFCLESSGTVQKLIACTKHEANCLNTPRYHNRSIKRMFSRLKALHRWYTSTAHYLQAWQARMGGSPQKCALSGGSGSSLHSALCRAPTPSDIHLRSDQQPLQADVSAHKSCAIGYFGSGCLFADAPEVTCGSCCDVIAHLRVVEGV